MPRYTDLWPLPGSVTPLIAPSYLGLAGFEPDRYDHARAEAAYNEIRDSKTVTPPGLPTFYSLTRKTILYLILAPACPAMPMV